ncbi:MAG: hypothetical protein ACI9JN_001527 [Bacteroidia bacterium]|jgi:hypothetical protein
MLEEGYWILYIHAGIGFWYFLLRLRTVYLIKKYDPQSHFSYFNASGWRLNEFKGLMDQTIFMDIPEHHRHELKVEFTILILLRITLFIAFLAWVAYLILVF